MPQRSPPSPSTVYDVIIVGSGIIGLSSAYHLLYPHSSSAATHKQRQPLAILIVEASLTQNASWNAAGILSTELGRCNLNHAYLKPLLHPPHESLFSPARAFLLHSLTLMPSWLLQIEHQSGIRPLFIPIDSYQTYTTSPACSILASLHSRAHRERLACGAMLDELPAFLSQHVHLPPKQSTRKISYFPSEYSVPPRRLLAALRHILTTSHQVTFLSGKVTSFYNLPNPAPQKIKQKTLVNVEIEHTDPPPSPLKSTAKTSLAVGKTLLLTVGAQLTHLLEKTPYSLNSHYLAGMCLRIPPFLTKNALVTINRKYYLLHHPTDVILGGSNRKITAADLIDGENIPHLPPTHTPLPKYVPQLENELLTACKQYFSSPKLTHLTQFTTNKHVIERAWGIRGRTSDRLPLLGALGNEKHVLVSALYYKNGYALAPLAAQYISTLIHNTLHSPQKITPPTIITPLTTLPPQFFTPFQPLRKHGIRMQ